jgi:hypothetical protein
MRYLGELLLGLWLMIVLPLWLIMMAFGKKVFLLPPFDGNGLSFVLQFTAMYLPPLLFVATRFIRRPIKDVTTNA